MSKQQSKPFMQALISGAITAGMCLIATASFAQDFYRGRQIFLVVGSPPGGGYDLGARLLAKYWPKYIPGHPVIVVQNMPGAGSIAATNYVTNVANKDGLTVLAPQNTIAYEPMMGLSGGKSAIHFDLLKMNWLGSMSKEVSVPVVLNPPPVKSFQELLDTKKSIKMGSTGVSTPNSLYPHLMNAVLGTHFEIIDGYPGQGDVFLAMQNGELEGSGAPFYSSLSALEPDWLRDKKATILVQIALEKHPALPDVPLITEFAKTKEAMQSIELATAALSMGRPYALPEGVPADRIKILRDAFQATMKDPELLQEARKVGLEISPIDGDAVHDLLVKMYNTPQPIIDKVTSIFVRQ